MIGFAGNSAEEGVPFGRPLGSLEKTLFVVVGVSASEAAIMGNLLVLSYLLVRRAGGAAAGVGALLGTHGNTGAPVRIALFHF